MIFKRKGAILITIIVIVFLLVAVASYFVFYNFYYTPPPSTKTASYSCDSLESNSDNSTLEFSVNGVNITLLVEPGVSQISMSNCAYLTTSVNTPVRCGVMCGGRLGSIQYYTDNLRFSLSMTPVANNLNYSLVLESQDTPLLSTLFLNGAAVFVNTQVAYAPLASAAGFIQRLLRRG